MSFEKLSTAILTVAALGVAGAMVHREFFPDSPPTDTGISDQRIERVDNWEGLVSQGIRIGPSDAAITIVEFSDYECPFCKRFHSTFEQVKAETPGTVALVLLHYPLAMHRFANVAANASECAHEQGQFAQFTKLAFEKQDSLGLKSWGELALDAGIADTVGFNSCLRSGRTKARVERNVAIGEQLSVQSTPTIIVNGWRYAVPPKKDELTKGIRALLSGNVPPGAIQ